MCSKLLRQKTAWQAQETDTGQHSWIEDRQRNARKEKIFNGIPFQHVLISGGA